MVLTTRLLSTRSLITKNLSSSTSRTFSISTKSNAAEEPIIMNKYSRTVTANKTQGASQVS